MAKHNRYAGGMNWLILRSTVALFLVVCSSVVVGEDAGKARQRRSDAESFHEWLYRFGDPPTPTEVERMLARAAQNPTDGEALFWAGRCEQQGLVVKGRIDGMDYYRRAAGTGHVEAMGQWGTELGAGIHTAQNREEGRRLVNAAAEAGNARAHFNLAVTYLYGTDGEQKDLRKAETHARKAIEGGFLPALGLMSNVYLEQSDPKAEEYLHKAMSAGDPVAIKAFLVEACQYNMATPRHVEDARYVLFNGALHGNPELMRLYALASEAGYLSIPRDPYLAKSLLCQAARRGDVPAALRLAQVRLESPDEAGMGRRVLERLARELSGAEKAEAEHALGGCLFEGIGGVRDRARGRALVADAAANGCKEASETLARLPAAQKEEPVAFLIAPATAQEQFAEDLDEFEDWAYRRLAPPSVGAVQRMLDAARKEKPQAAALRCASLIEWNGWHGEPNGAQRDRYLEQAAAAGDLSEKAELGLWRFSKAKTPEEAREAFAMVEDAAGQLSIVGLHSLGRCYGMEAPGWSPNLAKSAELLEKAGKAGLVKATYEASLVYRMLGQKEKAESLLQQAAERGSREAIRIALGQLEAAYRGEKADIGVFIKHGLRAALWGEPVSLCSVGVSLKGPLDLKRVLIRRAAAAGSLQARAILAAAHVTGDLEVPVDVERGLADLEELTLGGTNCDEANWQLGRLLVEGKHVGKDAARGRELIERAARNGHAEAKEWLARENAVLNLR